MNTVLLSKLESCWINCKVAILTLILTWLIIGCASMGQQIRIGRNDGSDLCYGYLENIDNLAIYYKDERLKQLLKGAAIGSVAGAGLGAGTTALFHGDLAVGAIVGGIAGGITGAFVANHYWEQRLQQANQQKDLAISYVENDLRDDIEKINTLDKNVAALVKCRIMRRDFIRKQYADKVLTQQQVEQEWQKWGELINKDREEMRYVEDALNNIKKIEDSYHYAATMIDSHSATVNSDWADAEDSKLDKSDSKKTKKTKKHTKGKKTKTHKSEISKSTAKPIESPGSKVNTMVSSIHEKYESINKNKNEFDHLAVEANNAKGFEQIESRLPPFEFVPYDSIELLSCKERNYSIFY